MTAQNVTLAYVASQFLSQPGYAKTTLRSYEQTLQGLLQQYGSIPVQELTRQDLEAYLNGLTHLAYTTHRRHQAIVAALLNFAVERGYLVANPIARLKTRKPDRDKGEHNSDEPVSYLTPEQLTLLYEATASEYRLGALVRLLHQTGARVSEVLALDWGDVDNACRKFQVVGKGNKQRWCFYGDDAAAALDLYLRYERHPGHDALFTAAQPFSGEVSRLSYATAYKDFTAAIAPYAQLEGIRLHDLRHTFATERVGLMGIEELRALMGHENIQTTLRYQKVTSARAEVVARQALQSLR